MNELQKHYDVLHEMKQNLLQLQQKGHTPNTYLVVNTVQKRILEALPGLNITADSGAYFKPLTAEDDFKNKLAARIKMVERFMDLALREYRLEAR